MTSFKSVISKKNKSFSEDARRTDTDSAKGSKKLQSLHDFGIVTSVADGIVNILGSKKVAYGETVEIFTSAGPIVCLALMLNAKK